MTMVIHPINKLINLSPIMAFLGCLQILNIISVYVQHSYKLETFPQLFLWDSSIEIELLEQKGGTLESH